MSMYSTTQSNPVTGDEYFLCHNCNSINVVSARKNREKKVLWEVRVEKGIKRMFKILAASLDMDQEECLIYLLHLHDKEKKGQIQDISVAGGFYEKDKK